MPLQYTYLPAVYGLSVHSLLYIFDYNISVYICILYSISVHPSYSAKLLLLVNFRSIKLGFGVHNGQFVYNGQIE